MQKIWFLLILIPLFFSACDKDDNNGQEGQSLVFTSLQADRDTIPLGQKAKITATASGYQLTYLWKASLGDILGSGSRVEYSPSVCAFGKINITCTVKDGYKNEISKELFLVVN